MRNLRTNARIRILAGALGAALLLMAHLAPALDLPAEPPQTADSQTTITLWHPLGGDLWTSRTGFGKIQDAIDAALEGATIIVPPGNYPSSLTLDKDLTLRSIDPHDWNVVKSTRLEDNNRNRSQKIPIIAFAGTITERTHLRGLTITGYHIGAWQDGESPLVGNGSSPTIEHNYFYRNKVQIYYYDVGSAPVVCYFGGAILDCDGVIKNNIFEHNTSNRGGALAYCDGLIAENIFINNYTTNVAIVYSGRYNYSQTLLHGDGSALAYCNGIVRNNTIFTEYGVHDVSVGCSGAFINNIVMVEGGYPPSRQYIRDYSPRYCCILNWTGGGEGNINSDPQFVDKANGDYRLRSTSPCIDAGITTEGMTLDFNGNSYGFPWSTEPRGDGSHVDIGAFEFIVQGQLDLIVSADSQPPYPPGAPVLIHWMLPPEAGTAVQLELRRAGSVLGSFGPFNSSTREDVTELTLPLSLAKGTDYTIMAVSVLNPAFVLETSPFAICGAGDAGVTNDLWLKYR